MVEGKGTQSTKETAQFTKNNCLNVTLPESEKNGIGLARQEIEKNRENFLRQSGPLTPMDEPQTPPTKQEELLLALEARDVDRFKELLDDREVRADFSYAKRGTCLEIACRKKNCEKFVELLLKKVRPNVHGVKPEPIHYAVEYGNIAALRLLLRDKRTKINVQNRDGRTPLHIAAMKFDTDIDAYSEILKMLLERDNLELNVPNKNNCTPIFEAAFYGKTGAAVLKMLELRPDEFNLDVPRSCGRSAREVILENFPDMVPKLPLVKLPSGDKSGEQVKALTELLNKRLEPFKRLLQQVDEDGDPVVDPNYVYEEPYPTTCLNEACKGKNTIEFVRVLLEAGANPNLVNRSIRRGPIHVAIYNSNLDAVDVLIEQKSFNVNIQDNSGNTPLHYIVKYQQNDECAKKYIEKIKKLRPDFKVRNKSRQTAYMMARIENRSDEIRALVNPAQAGYDERPKAFVLFQPLYDWDEAKFLNLLERVNDHNVLNISDRWNTLLQTACKADMKVAVKKLLEKGADPNKTTPNNPSAPVIIAASKEPPNGTLESLLTVKSCLDINVKDKNGDTALHIAAESRNLGAVVKLLRAGADIEAKNNLGKEPFPSSVLKKLLDSSMTTQSYPTDVNYVVKFNFELLLASKPETGDSNSSKNINAKSDEVRVQVDGVGPETTSTISGRDNAQRAASVVQNYETELKMLSYIIKTHHESDIIKHPVITSFITLKWSQFKYLYYFNLGLTFLFTVFINLYICCGCYLKANCSSAPFLALKIPLWTLLGAICLWDLTEVFCPVGARNRNVYKGNIKKILCHSVKTCRRNIHKVRYWFIVFLVLTVLIPFDNTTIKLWFTVLTLVTSNVTLIMAFSCFSLISKYITILKKITKNYAYVLFLYSVILYSFSVCFFVLFRDTKIETFQYIHLAVFKVIMMMSGDIDTDYTKSDPTSGLSYILFTAFDLIVVIVLLNLLTGLAVRDIQKIKELAALLNVRSKVEKMAKTEIVSRRLYKWVPKKLAAFHSIDNTFTAVTKIEHCCFYPNRDSNLIVDGAKIPMNREWLSNTMKIVSEQSADGRKLSPDEQLVDTMKKIMSKVDAIDARINANHHHTDLKDKPRQQLEEDSKATKR